MPEDIVFCGCTHALPYQCIRAEKVWHTWHPISYTQPCGCPCHTQHNAFTWKPQFTQERYADLPKWIKDWIKDK